MANTSCLSGFFTDHVIHGFMQQLRKYGTKIQSRLSQVLKFNDSQQFKVSAVQRQLIKETSICLWVPGCHDFFLSAISSSYSVTYTLGAGYMEKFQPGLRFQPGCWRIERKSI